MNPTVLGGPAEVGLNGVYIPSHLLSEVSVELTEGTRERTTLAGTFSRPSGTFETATATFTMYLPSMDYLKHIFPDRYNAPSAPQTTGNVVFSTQTCATVEGGPVNIHFTCDDNDDNDVFFYNGFVQMNFNPTYNDSDDLTVEVTIMANPDDDGNVARLGTGDLEEESVYDVASGETVPVSS